MGQTLFGVFGIEEQQHSAPATEEDVPAFERANLLQPKDRGVERTSGFQVTAVERRLENSGRLHEIGRV